MRLKISLDKELVRALDLRAGKRGRNAFINSAIRSALADEKRWDRIQQAIGSIDDQGHAWDEDPAGWVRHGRRAGG